MTPDQVQKDLELVLKFAEARSWLHYKKRGYDMRQAIARLRSVKLVAVEEAPEGVPPQLCFSGRAIREQSARTGGIYVVAVEKTGPNPPDAMRYIYAGTVTVDENGKVDG